MFSSPRLIHAGRLALVLCVGINIAGQANAQASLWNQYQGASAPVDLGYATNTGNADANLHYLGAYLAVPPSTQTQNPALPTNIQVNTTNGNSWTVDTGSTGVVITSDYLYQAFHITASQLTPIAPASITYTSSSLTYSGFYASLDVGLYNSSGNSGALAAVSQVPVLVATQLTNGKTGKTTWFCSSPSNCTVSSNSLEQFGIGFGRGETIGQTYLNPLLNLISTSSSNVSTMAPGYVVTNSKLSLGLSAAQLSNALLVSLQASPQTQPTSLTNPYAQAATKSDWKTPPMLLAISNNKYQTSTAVNGTYYGTMLVDTGVSDTILTNGYLTGQSGAATLNSALLGSSSPTHMTLLLPGLASGTGQQPGQFTYIYQGVCNNGTSTGIGCGPSANNTTPYSGGNSNVMLPIYPTSSIDSYNNGQQNQNTGFADASTATAFLNTGVNFLNSFNIVYDPVSGFIFYQPNSMSYPWTTNLPAASAMLALQGPISIPNGTILNEPIFLYTDIGNQTTPSLVPIDVSLSAGSPSGIVTINQPISSDVIAGCTAVNCSTGVVINQGTFIFSTNNTYSGQTTVNAGATLALGPSGSIAASSGLVANGTFDISSTITGASIASLTGNGLVSLGSQALTIGAASSAFSGVIADGGMNGGAGGSLVIAGGRQTLSGSNLYTGSTTIAPGATLAIAGSGSIARSSGVTANGLFDISGTSAGASVTALSGAGNVNLGAQTLTVTNANTAFAGTISGSGGLVIAGGTQALTGSNLYTGGTTVAGGATLAVAADTSLGAPTSGLTLNAGALLALSSFSTGRSITIGTNGGVLDANGFQLTVNGPLTISGPFATLGSVTLANTVTIDNGTTSINGSFSAASLYTASQGTLRGTGTINAPTRVDGRLAPGNSPGTLTFTMPVVLGPGSTTEFDIDGTGTGTGAGNYSRIIVSGSSFTANGTLAPQLRGISGNATNLYTPPLGQGFTVITASGGLSGSYTSLTQPTGLAAGTRFDALYTPTTLNLVVTPAAYGNLALAGLVETTNQSAVGAALDNARPVAGVAMNAAQASVYAPLYPLPAGAITATLEQLSPTIYGDAQMVGRQNWYLVGGAIDEQLEARRGISPGDKAQTAQGPSGSTIWLTGLGLFGDVASNGTSGYSSSSGGTAIGIDVSLNPALLIGAAFGFSNQVTSAKNSASFTGDAFQFEAYGSVRQGIVFLDMQAGGAFSEGTATRTLYAYGVQAKGDTTGSAGGGSMRAGVRLDVADWRIEPSLTLAGVSLHQNSLTETQGGPVGLSIGGASVGSLQTLLGARFEHPISIGERARLVPSVMVGWLHEYMDTQAATSASFIGSPGAGFTVQSAPIGRDSAALNLRAALDLQGPLSVFAGYAAALNRNSTAQTVSGGIRFVF